MKKVSKYKKQIFTFVTLFLLVTYGIFPALSAANTILNILGSIGLLVLIVWGVLELRSFFVPEEIDKNSPETQQDIKKEAEISDIKPKRKQKTAK
jgi:arginine exporter protein ArgO